MVVRMLLRGLRAIRKTFDSPFECGLSSFAYLFVRLLKGGEEHYCTLDGVN